MFKNQKLVNSLVDKIRKIEKETLEAFDDGRVEQEPAFTDRLLGSMEHALNGKDIAGVRWRAKTLTDRGRGSQESLVGADFMAAFELSLNGYDVAKGFLAQAKLIEPSQLFSTKEATCLKEQCEKMLRFSPASYVFLYSQHSGIVVVPAIEVIASRDCNPHELTSKKMADFYREHFECFIGDREIKRANREGLDALYTLRTQYEARSLVVISGSEPNEPQQLELNLYQ